MTLTVRVFSIEDDLSLSERTSNSGNFLDMVNTEFKSCSSSCNGLHFCDSIYKEFERFRNHIEKDKLRDQEKSNANFYVHFLAERNKAIITPLRITNILWALEVVMLSRPSKSSNERIVSIIEGVVTRQFSNIY